MYALLFLVMALAAFPAQAVQCQNFFNHSVSHSRQRIQLRSGHWVVGQHLPARSGHPTIVLLDGFISPFPSFDPVAERLHRLGAGVARYDYSTHGETLQANLEGKHLFDQPDFSLDVLADEADQTLKALKVPQGSIIVGLSYGALVLGKLLENYPHWAGPPVLLSPATRVSWRHMDPIQLPYATTQILQPWLGSDVKEVTDRELDHQILSAMLLGPYRKARPRHVPHALFRRGLARLEEIARDFEIDELLKHKRFHLLMAKRDTPLSRYRMRQFFKQLEDPGHLFVFPSPHGIHEHEPDALVAALMHIAKHPEKAGKFSWHPIYHRFRPLSTF